MKLIFTSHSSRKYYSKGLKWIYKKITERKEQVWWKPCTKK